MTYKRFNKYIANIGAVTFYKLLAILTSLLIVSISIRYLGERNYGLWVTIFTFMSWFSFFDFGLGNGLRNKLSHALSSNNHKLAREYISTAYVSIGIVLTTLSIALFAIGSRINWELMFNVDNTSIEFGKILAVVFSGFIVNLFLKIVNTVFYAVEKSSIPSLIEFCNQAFILSALFLIGNDISFLQYAFLVSFSQVIVLFIASAISYTYIVNDFKPSLANFNKEHIRELMGLGGKFFFIQITTVILYSTDSFIINYFLGSEKVTIYSVSLKYFSMITMFMTILLTPFWSAFANSLNKGDYNWVKGVLHKFIRVIGVLIALTLVMVMTSDYVYKVWIGSEFKSPPGLSLAMGLNAIALCIVQLSCTFINSTGKIIIHIVVGSLSAILNIILSIYLAVSLDLGVLGVVIASLVSNLFVLLFYPYQAYLLINRRAKGLWDL